MDPSVCVEIGGPQGIGEAFQNDVGTPCSLNVSETACSLKQSRLLFPPTAIPNYTTPTTTPPEDTYSNCSPPSQSTATPTADTAPMEVSESGRAGSAATVTVTSSTPTTIISDALQMKVKQTKREREAMRQERERLKAETQALKEEERLKKEKARLNKELEKKARREQREREERERRERKEAKEREKREKQEKRERERVRREEEERRRREEKQRAELEKQQFAEEKTRRKLREQEMFTSFFSKLPKNGTQNNEHSEGATTEASFNVAHFDHLLQIQATPTTPYLTECRPRRLHNNKPRPPQTDDVIIMSSPVTQLRPRMKLLQFHSNVRPAYFGSWRKQSKAISGRAPFKMDREVLDYEFDSDEEWEEEEPGESVSSASEGEDSGREDSGEEGEEDGFFVPHGYLSEDEGEHSETEEGSEGAQMDKVKAKAKAWEAEFQRTCQPKQAVCIGCVWAGGEGERDSEFLAQFSALVLADTTPVPLGPPPTTVSTSPESHGTGGADAQRRPVPEEAMPDLIRLVHRNTAGLAKLVKLFQAHWAAVLCQRAPPPPPPPPPTVATAAAAAANIASPSLPLPSSSLPSARESLSPQLSTTTTPGSRDREPDVNQSRISKRQLEMKIQSIAVKEVRPPATKPTWYVHDSVLESYKIGPSDLLAPLSVATTKSCSVSAEKSSGSPPDSTPVSRKPAKRRASGNTPTLYDVIGRSPQTTSSPAATNSAQKRLKLAPSPGSGLLGPEGNKTGPPKKRIRLESVELGGEFPARKTAELGAGGREEVRGREMVIVIDDSSSNSTSTESVQDSKLMGRPNGSVTPSRKAPHMSLAVSNSPGKQGAKSRETKLGAYVVTDNCLQEVTNSNQRGATSTDAKDTEKGDENRPSVNWQMLLKAAAVAESNSNQVTVAADVH